MKPTILTDIEGTTSRIDFVHQVLFPYARARIANFVHAHRDQADVATALAAVRTELNAPEATLDAQIEALLRWIDEDRKVTPLKSLQGMIWAQGYAAGDFTAHVYADAYDALRRWHKDAHPLYVYSSGSIAAQKLFFRYSVFGDLTPLFREYFDTTIGGKREAGSYRLIAQRVQRPAGEILFLSDIEAELDAARDSGMQTIQLLRVDAPPASTGSHRTVASMADIGAIGS
ncbi:MAG: acireductone synthase [Pseudomonadota bacterium]|nr:acireductone synthase [Pseudomonadota bacterium]